MHRTQPVDLLILRELSRWIPIVPLISHTDKMNMSELNKFKNEVRKCIGTVANHSTLTHHQLAIELQEKGINIFRLDKALGPERVKRNSMFHRFHPGMFGVIGSDRNYSWGTAKTTDWHLFDNCRLIYYLTHPELPAKALKKTAKLAKHRSPVRETFWRAVEWVNQRGVFLLVLVALVVLPALLFYATLSWTQEHTETGKLIDNINTLISSLMTSQPTASNPP